MDLKQVGSFLKRLRNEKGLTQEELAEYLNVSNRTISRWETGNNMPDISILVEIAEFYATTIPEILRGERNNKSMNNEVKETVLKVAEYSNEEKKKSAKIVIIYFVCGIIALIINLVLNLLEKSEGSLGPLIGFFEGFTWGVSLVSMILGILYMTGKLEKIRALKKSHIKKNEKRK